MNWPSSDYKSLIGDEDRSDVDAKTEDAKTEDTTLCEFGADDGREYTQKTRRHSARRCFYKTAIIALFIILVAIGASGGEFIYRIASSSSSGTSTSASNKRISLGKCGRDVEENLRNNCVFDIMVSAWVHRACYPQDLSEKFLTQGHWTWYADREGTHEIPQEVVLRGDYDVVYTQGTYHFLHCTYVWAKYRRAHEQEHYILDSRARMAHHTDHCMQFVGSPNVTYLQDNTSSKLTRAEHEIDCIMGP